MFLRFVGQDGDYRLKNGIIYPCKVYTKDHFIWVQARNYAFKFPKRYVRIPYRSVERICYEWTTYDVKTEVG